MAPGELYPRVGFIVTNLRRPARKVVAFYNQRGTAEQWILAIAPRVWAAPGDLDPSFRGTGVARTVCQWTGSFAR